MSKILYEVYKNAETMSLAKMAKHISEHGSVFTDDVVEGVMKKFKNCLLEMLLNSRKVKITGLGTFYLTAECQKGGADKEEDFNVREHLKASLRVMTKRRAVVTRAVTVVAPVWRGRSLSPTASPQPLP